MDRKEGEQGILAWTARFPDLAPEDRTWLVSRFEETTVAGRRDLVRVGEICDRIFFVREGVLAMVHLKGDREYIRDFAFPGDMVSVYESFLTGRPARYALRALGPCSLAVWRDAPRELSASRRPSIDGVLRRVAEGLYLNLSSRFESLMVDSAQERYLALIAKRPDLLQEVPQYLVASYIGITDVALSRLRGRLAKSEKRGVRSVS